MEIEKNYTYHVDHCRQSQAPCLQTDDTFSDIKQVRHSPATNVKDISVFVFTKFVSERRELFFPNKSQIEIFHWGTDADSDAFIKQQFKENYQKVIDFKENI